MAELVVWGHKTPVLFENYQLILMMGQKAFDSPRCKLHFGSLKIQKTLTWA